MKFNDANGNGTKDNGENGLANWEILLSGNATDSQKTNANGNYVFSNLPAGTYTVSEVLQNGWTQTLPSSGSYAVNVSAGENVTGKDFGNYQDTMKFRTFKADTSLSTKAVKLQFKNNRLVAQPNIATALENVFSSLGKTGATFLGIKQTEKDSSKKYAWVAYKKASVLGKLYTSPHILSNQIALAFPLDSVRSVADGRIEKKKALVKELVPDRKKYNNKMLEQGVCFRLNILASVTGDTTIPYGFGALVLDTSYVLAGRELKGQTMQQIANYTDTLMTYWKGYGIAGFEAYSTLYNFSTKILQRINDEFSASIETTNYAINKDKILFTKKVYLIKLLGIKTASDVGIVKYAPGKNEENFSFESISNDEASGFALQQNYPNPFNPTTTIHYTLSTAALVSMKVYNVLGQEVAVLIDNERMESGEYEVQFDASGLTSGVYFYRLNVNSENGNFTATKKLLLMK
jgi:hypothetical protein